MPRIRSKNNDLTGQRFGRWLVLSRAFHSKANGSMFKCRCDCKQEREVSLSNLRAGASQSCGCLNRERNSADKRIHGQSHGPGLVHITPEYGAWQSMKGRCYNPKSKDFKNYGARGIVVCDRWRDSFANFFADIGKRPGSAYTIERKNVNGNYEPDNCIWLHRSKQPCNKRNTIRVTHCGETKTLADWARQYNFSHSALKYRLFVKKMPFAEAVTQPLGKRPVYVTYKGERIRISKLARLKGIDRDVLGSRLKMNWDIERAVSEPVRDQTHSLIYKGETKTLTEWCRAFGMDDATVLLRLRKFWSVEEALETPPDPRYQRSD